MREYGDINNNKHYHVLLFLNKNAYFGFGDYGGQDNLAVLIKDAWDSATGFPVTYFDGLVHFGQRHHLLSNSISFEDDKQAFLRYADYLAKHVTKSYGDGQRSIGSSNITVSVSD